MTSVDMFDIITGSDLYADADDFATIGQMNAADDYELGEAFAEGLREGIRDQMRNIIVKVIANEKAVIVFWLDGTKTVVKKMDTDPNDIYSAVAQALAKKIYGSTTQFHKMVDDTTVCQKPKGKK